MRFAEYISSKLDGEYLRASIDYEMLKQNLCNIKERNEDFEKKIQTEIERVINLARLKNQNVSQKALEQVRINSSDQDEIEGLCFHEERILTHNTMNFLKINIVGIKKILKKYDMKTKENLYNFYKPVLKKELRYMKEMELYLVDIWEAASSNSSEESSESKAGYFKCLARSNIANKMVVDLIERCQKEANVDSFNCIEKDFKVQRIYFDNREREMFHKKLDRSRNSFLLRLEYDQDTNKEATMHLTTKKGKKTRKFKVKLPINYLNEYIYGKKKIDGSLEKSTALKRIKSLVTFYNLKPCINIKYTKKIVTSEKFEINHIFNITTTQLNKADNINEAFLLLSTNNYEAKKGHYNIIYVKSPGMVNEWMYRPQNNIIDVNLKFSTFFYSRILLSDFSKEVPMWVTSLSEKLNGIDVESNANPVEISVIRHSHENKVDLKTSLCFSYFVFLIGILGSVSVSLQTFFYTTLGYFMINLSIFMGVWLLWSIYKQNDNESNDYKKESIIPICTTISGMFMVLFVFYTES